MLLLKGKDNLADSNKKSNRKRMLTLCSVLLLVLGAVAVIAGGFIMYKNTTNDSEGYTLSNTYTVQTPANAFILWVGSPHSEARLKWVVTSLDSDTQVFAGWGTADTVNAYTHNYQYATPASGWSYTARSYEAKINITNVQIINPDRPALPPTQDLWLNTVTTANTATLYCTSNNEDGKNSMLVIMNADGSNGVEATIQLGSRIALYSWLPYILLPAGLLLLIIGVFLVRKTRKN
jgi:hypothetical protein